MGSVYLANDRRTGRPVAIKVMTGLAWDAVLEARLLREGRTLATLDQRNIVRFLEITRSRDGTPSIVMEVVEGADYEEVLSVLDREALRPPSETPVSVEESQQKRWPDLEKTVDTPARRLEVPAIETGPASPPTSADTTSTAAALESGESERGSEVPTWMGGAAKGPPPLPVRSSADPVQDKTERLDDVIAKLRQQAVLEPVTAAPPSQPVRRPETAPEPSRANERVPAAQPAPAGRRLVVYGEPPPPAVKAPPRPAPPAMAAAAAPAPDTTGRRIRLIGVGLIVAAIVILFAAVLWVLISLVRGATPGGTPRTSRSGSSWAVAGAAHRFVDPKSE